MDDFTHAALHSQQYPHAQTVQYTISDSNIHINLNPQQNGNDHTIQDFNKYSCEHRNCITDIHHYNDPCPIQYINEYKDSNSFQHFFVKTYRYKDLDPVQHTIADCNSASISNSLSYAHTYNNIHTITHSKPHCHNRAFSNIHMDGNRDKFTHTHIDLYRHCVANAHFHSHTNCTGC